MQKWKYPSLLPLNEVNHCAASFLVLKAFQLVGSVRWGYSSHLKVWHVLNWVKQIWGKSLFLGWWSGECPGCRKWSKIQENLGKVTEPRRCFSKPHCFRATLSADTVSWWSEISYVHRYTVISYTQGGPFQPFRGSVNCMTLKVTKVYCLKFWNICRNDTFILNLDPNQIMKVCFLRLVYIVWKWLYATCL